MRIRILGAVLLLAVASQAAAVDRPDVRLYTIDCGRLDFKDMGPFSDTGDYDGKEGSIADGCFLIQHPKGLLLWDTGLSDALVGHESPANKMGMNIHMQASLIQQLARIGVKPADITYLAFSHLHGDHTGNANAFAAAKWIMNQREMDWALSTPTPLAVDPASFSAYDPARALVITGDWDVFGDGTVRILKTPGHTPGHQVLQIRLRRTGVVILSGDLYHLRSDRAQGIGRSGRLMTLNSDRADTLASMDRVETILRNTRGRLIIQHDPDDFRSLPLFPAYLD